MNIDRETFLGKPKHFNPDLYCDAVEHMIMADELERALWMLDNMPGYYRENKYPRAIQIKEEIYRNTKTVKDYINNGDESDSINIEELKKSSFTYPRFDVLCEKVREFNKDGKSPNIYEFGPAGFWLPMLLKDASCEYQYKWCTINKEAEKTFQNSKYYSLEGFKPNQPNLFVCYETIEHLWNPMDIAHFYHKANIDADMVFLSTPHNTLLGGLESWKDRKLEHLRTYTETDFIEFAYKAFPNRVWQLTRAQMMVIVGDKNANS